METQQDGRRTYNNGENDGFPSLDAIQAHNASCGYHFFDRDTMRAFGSKVYGPVVAGRYFITSEQDRHMGAWDGERRYTVRYAADDGTIDTVNSDGSIGYQPCYYPEGGEPDRNDGFGCYSTLDGARRAAKRIAKQNAGQ